ncbi:MAG: TolC family protein [Acidobacteria bacterium]|nr:TolC family protein [Acidobacteriota bacterium]
MYSRKVPWAGVILACTHWACAETRPLTIEQAVRAAAERYPAAKSASERVASAAAAIRLARTAFLPQADAIAQLNRATHNNVYGMILPQSILPSIPGPAFHTNSGSNVWGSAAGFTVSWEPFDFGLRQSQVDAAEAARKREEAALDRTRLDVAATAADAFLTVLAAEQTLKGVAAALARARVVEETVATLVKADLRPGIDLTRARAERINAETQLEHARQAVQVAGAALAQFAGPDAAVSPGKLLGPAPGLDQERASAQHPAAVEQDASIEESKARLKVLDRTFYPRFNYQTSVFGRGSGAFPDGRSGGPASGLGPNFYNWGTGLTVTFPFLSQPGLRARKEMETHRTLAEQRRYEQVLTDLDAQKARAAAMLEGARRVARNTPLQLENARAVEMQAMARYKAGIGTVIEIADAQRLIAQAEIDDALARLAIWRAMLAVAVSQGDLDSYLAAASKE